ncbi:hypothetical protein BMETH_55_4 [methanotrophic bacterial endosymbiont of Bathymodiolus sp.]|nr:hypothetical protein BMETH_55_4 [methanotrophic bacterial endosymbiont of Bathymodiolus sp.]
MIIRLRILAYLFMLEETEMQSNDSQLDNQKSKTGK